METNLEQKENIREVIERTNPLKLPDVPEIANRFKHLYAIIHPGHKADMFFEAEKFHFAKLIKDNAELQKCTKMSLYGCFIDVAVNGLSFDPSFKHLYLVPFNVNIGTKNNPQWEKRAMLQISGYGELALRQMQGQVKYADNPVLVYEGDDFSYGVANGRSFVNHTAHLGKRSSRILACYICITRHDGTSDFKVLTQEDMDRFRKFSKDADRSKAWNEGIGGMWQSKCIKHAFKNYPKVRTGDHSQLASEQVDEEAQEIDLGTSSMQMPESIDYGTGEHDDDFTQSTTETEPGVSIQDDDF